MQTFEQSLHYTLKIGLPACTRKHNNRSTNGVKLAAKERKMTKCPAIPLLDVAKHGLFSFSNW